MANGDEAPRFDQRSWEERWSSVLATRGDQIAGMPASAYVTELAGTLEPGRALDAGCGHGAETLWLAGHGWQVTAVDFSRAALEHGRAMAERLGPDVAPRVDWVEGDLGVWAPEPDAYDLVACLYVHVAGAVPELVQRLASGVAPGGTLVLIGHLPADLDTGEPSPAAGQRQVTVAEATAALDPAAWELVVAEDRRRATAGTGHDAVIQARRGVVGRTP